MDKIVQFGIVLPLSLTVSEIYNVSYASKHYYGNTATAPATDTHQLGPRYEGQLMSDGGAYSPFRSILFVLTHDFIITCVYGPTGSDGHERKDADSALRTIFVPFEAKGVLYAWGPVQPANGPLTRTTSG